MRNVRFSFLSFAEQTSARLENSLNLNIIYFPSLYALSLTHPTDQSTSIAVTPPIYM